MLSKNIKKYRRKKKLSKLELSRRTALSARTIDFLENGTIENPKLKTLQVLSKALEVDLEELLK